MRGEKVKSGLAGAVRDSILVLMSKPETQPLRRGWTTGACATAATKAALTGLWQGDVPAHVKITLPGGQQPVFEVAHRLRGAGWAEAGIVKDAGDDPDVTHGALISVRVEASSHGVVFVAGEGVGTVTKPGLPLPPGEAAINPVPRQMMEAVVQALSRRCGTSPDIRITVSIPNGRALAKKTWNGRLGIVDGLSILGTTGIVRPFSCSAWIASIHRGIDVARATHQRHVAGCTGATSEKAVQRLHGLPDHAMLDMGGFSGGLLKYLAKHPVARLTIGGGIGKMTKLSQGAGDLHSKRSAVDFRALDEMARTRGLPGIADANTALEALERAGNELAKAVAQGAASHVHARLGTDDIAVDVVVVDRRGKVLAQEGPL